MVRKYGSIFGLVLGILAIFGSFFLEGGTFRAIFLIPPMIIVFGGTFAAIIIGFGLDKFFKIFPLIKLAYYPIRYDYAKLINVFHEMAIELRRNGILSIEKLLNQFDHYFPQKLVKYFIDGADIDEITNLAKLEMTFTQERHMNNIFIFTKMGGYAPTMGILGTVMGLIMTLSNAGNEPEVLIRNIASAFIATLWGVFTANILWLPIGDKLKQCHLEEKLLMELTLEAVIALRSGEVPSLLRTRMISMLPPRQQEELQFR